MDLGALRAVVRLVSAQPASSSNNTSIPGARGYKKENLSFCVAGPVSVLFESELQARSNFRKVKILTQ